MLASSHLGPKGIKDIVNSKLAKFSGSLLGAVTPKKQSTLPKAFELSPHIDYKRYGSTHYGIMVPDLPEPYRYLSWASVIGYVGFPITDSEYQMSIRGKGDTASLVHGTALSSTEEAFKTYSIVDDIQFSEKPFSVIFNNETSLTEIDNGFLLTTKREDLQIEIHLVPTGAITWFAYGSLYKHFSVLMKYEGRMIQNDESIEVNGLCTLESWKAIATSMLKNQTLVNAIQIPVKIFSYQVINLDDEQQLVLAFICYEDQPILTSVYYRHIDGTSIQFNGDIRFEVTKNKVEPQITPDGYSMYVPETFEWIAYHDNLKILEIRAEVDTAYCYGLAAGYVSSYKWQGMFQGKDLIGRGYLEYIDRR
ncbi:MULTISPECIES: DUF6670 family protein [Acinetobacter]|nr:MULTISPECIES: DUF6670 family protein [Acinetobacter]MCH7293709.1 hypothetical protein [Acinetobacter higginsii]MCH7319107.1 hypothetical protein [Acinetobacter higginsii]MCH7340045.1 hypothetical protein [Acinetobacter higginsii]MCI3878022.1 hypothetical protein [Acinetobacter higginsii]MDO3663854.1 hypothetical protein [Acinetobacter higginsii]